MKDTEKWKILFCSHSLKIIAIITMIIDHIGYFIFPGQEIYRIIGRISFPLFAFLTAYGFTKTKNDFKYTMRIIFMFFLIQTFITWYLLSANLIDENPFYINIFFVLGISAIIIFIWKNNKIISIIMWIFIVIFFVFLNKYNPKIYISSLEKSFSIEIDYGLYGFLLITLMYFFAEQILIFIPNKTNIVLKMTRILIFISLVFLDIYVLNLKNSLGNIRFYALLAVPIFILFMDINLKINKYVQYLLYFVYPATVGITILIKMLK